MQFRLLSVVSLLLVAGCSQLFEPMPDSQGDPDAGPSGLRIGDFYIGPEGDDKNDGLTISSPFRTWAHAVGQLGPGMTLVALDGVYDGEAGALEVDCSAGQARSGEADKPISIAARTPRHAWLRRSDDAGPTIRVACSHWNIEDLHVTGAKSDNAKHSLIEVVASFVRLTGLYLDDQLNGSDASISIRDSQHVLVSQLEAYGFSGAALRVEDSSEIEIRMSYFNGASALGSTAIYFLGSSDSSVDNVIVEDVTYGIHVTVSGQGSDNISISGSVVRKAESGYVASSWCSVPGDPENPPDPLCSSDTIVSGLRISNSVAIDCSSSVTLRGMVGAVVDRFSSIESSWVGFRLELGGEGNLGIPDKGVLITNSLISGKYHGARVSESFPVTLRNINIFDLRADFEVGDVATDIDSLSNVELTELHRLDPDAKQCQAYLKADSPMHDLQIGANALYRTTGGGLNLLDELVWVDGEFPCGQALPEALLPKVNCHNLVDRLETRARTCTRP